MTPQHEVQKYQQVNLPLCIPFRPSDRSGWTWKQWEACRGTNFFERIGHKKVKNGKFMNEICAVSFDLKRRIHRRRLLVRLHDRI
jgi:hypothetical protein